MNTGGRIPRGIALCLIPVFLMLPAVLLIGCPSARAQTKPASQGDLEACRTSEAQLREVVSSLKKALARAADRQAREAQLTEVVNSLKKALARSVVQQAEMKKALDAAARPVADSSRAPQGSRSPEAVRILSAKVATLSAELDAAVQAGKTLEEKLKARDAKLAEVSAAAEKDRSELKRALDTLEKRGAELSETKTAEKSH